jgi:shikimate dehydrogenase
MRTFGLIGFPLTHSFSPDYFAKKFSREGITDQIYKSFPLERIEDLPTLLKSEKLSGLNVTIPYKESVIKYLDDIDSTAQSIGAVNCIKITDGKLKGYNTDAVGFTDSLKAFLGNTKPQALILGTGGSSKAVAFSLDSLNIAYQFVSRLSKDNCITYHDLTPDITSTHQLIINTTPIGMYPRINEAPDIPYEYLTAGHYLFDLIYNPEQTLFLRQGVRFGAHVKNGLEMLHLQAEKSWEIWNQ